MQPAIGQEPRRGSTTMTHASEDAEFESGIEMSQLTNAASRQDIPLDGGYGWVCTLAVFLINASTWGVNSVSLLNVLFEGVGN